MTPLVLRPEFRQTLKVNATPVRPAKPARGSCFHLGPRVEYRAGCSSGRGCKHVCGHEEPEPYAVPAGNCQACPKHEPQ